VPRQLDATHDPARRSWVEEANRPGADFPIQNLPHGVFRRRGQGEAFRGGVAIGDSILDIEAALARGLLPDDVAAAARAAAKPQLNEFMGMARASRRRLRSALSDLLTAGAHRRDEAKECLVPQADAEHTLPASIGDFSDFYSSLHHATNVGALFRPDNPILPNYRWLPVGYTGRTSSIRVSGTDVKRPSGQLKDAGADEPRYAPCRRLDYEVELGMFIGRGNELGTPIAIGDADEHLFGICILNDWSARDIQSWEYQPLGPFLSKSFLTTLSPWIVTMEALEPFRVGFSRPAGDPPPIAHLHDPSLAERGSIDIRVRVSIDSERMRAEGDGPIVISTSRWTDAYWAPAQLVAHQTSNGANLQSGDLLGSGTLSGPAGDSLGCLLELTQGGKKPISLSRDQTRTFLEDGDRVVMTAWCEAPGFARIGLGECAGTVRAAHVAVMR
jgi:fumarylacetoacetase